MADIRFGEDYRLKRFWWYVASLWPLKCLRGEKLVLHKAEKRIKGPAIVVGNHASLFDWWFAWRVLRKPNLTPVVARYFFSDSFNAYWLKHAGCIPKSVFTADNSSAIAMMRCLKHNGILLLFPEAHTGALSKNEPLPDDTALFIKRIGVPVYGVHVEGATLCFPKWGKKHAGGRIEVTTRQLYTKEQLKTIDKDVLARELVDYIAYDDTEFRKRNKNLNLHTKYPAEHVENAAWLCPACGTQGGLSSHGGEVSCVCGWHATIDGNYRMSDRYATVQDWISDCVEKLRDAAKDPSFEMRDDVTLRLPTHQHDGGQREAGRGICRLNHQGLFYKGTMDGKEVELSFPISSMFLLPFTAGRNFVVYEKEQCFIFCPAHKENCTRFSYASAVLTGAI